MRSLKRQSRANRALGYRGFQVLAYVRSTIATDGRAPSYDMIADATGIRSRAKVCEVVARLERRGLVARVGAGRIRRLRLPA